MTTVLRGNYIYNCLLNRTWKPQRNAFRFMAKANVQRPKRPHYERDKVEKLCLPYYPLARENDPAVPLYELCEGVEVKEEKKENPLEYYLTKDCLNLFDKHKLIFFFHKCSLEIDEDYEIKIMLKRMGISCREFDDCVIQRALTGTIYEPALVLFKSNTLVGFSENTDIGTLVSSLRKTQKIILMAGIACGRLLSVSELNYYNELKDIQTVRASLVSTLNAVAGNLVQKLNQHPNTLVQYLQQYAKIKKE